MNLSDMMAPDPRKPTSTANRPYDWLVIDGGGLAVTAWSTHRDLEHADARIRAATYVFTTCLASLAKLINHDAKIVVAWDGHDNRAWRRGLHPWYKHGRTSNIDRKEVGVVVALVEQLLHAIGVATVKVDGREADDLVATLSRQVDQQMLIFSDDKDYLQAIGPNVHLARRSMQGIIMTPSECDVMDIAYGDQYLYMKAMMGDSGDNVRGLPGIGETKARALVELLPDVLHISRADPDLVDWASVPDGLRKAFAGAGRKLIHPSPCSKAGLDGIKAFAKLKGIPYHEYDIPEMACLQVAMIEAVRCLDLVTLDYEVEFDLVWPESNLEAIPSLLGKMGLGGEHDLLTNLYRLAGMSSARQLPNRAAAVRSGAMEGA